MDVQQDFAELLALFNEHRVEYVIVGGYALAFHGAPRYTGDLDLYVKADQDNAQRILQALQEFGFGSLGLRTEDFSTIDQVIQLGVAPVRIDLVTSITGVSWEQAYTNRVAGSFGEVQVNYIGRAEFIQNKRASGRYQDLADIEALGEDAGSSDAGH